MQKREKCLRKRGKFSRKSKVESRKREHRGRGRPRTQLKGGTYAPRRNVIPLKGEN